MVENHLANIAYAIEKWCINHKILIAVFSNFLFLYILNLSFIMINVGNERQRFKEIIMPQWCLFPWIIIHYLWTSTCKPNSSTVPPGTGHSFPLLGLLAWSRAVLASKLSGSCGPWGGNSSIKLSVLPAVETDQEEQTLSEKAWRPRRKPSQLMWRPLLQSAGRGC